MFLVKMVKISHKKKHKSFSICQNRSVICSLIYIQRIKGDHSDDNLFVSLFKGVVLLTSPTLVMICVYIVCRDHCFGNVTFIC